MYLFRHKTCIKQNYVEKRRPIFYILWTYQKEISKQLKNILSFKNTLKNSIDVASIFFPSRLHGKKMLKRRVFFIHHNYIEDKTSKRHESLVHQYYIQENMPERHRFFLHRNYIGKVRWDIKFLDIWFLTYQ